MRCSGLPARNSRRESTPWRCHPRSSPAKAWTSSTTTARRLANCCAGEARVETGIASSFYERLPAVCPALPRKYQREEGMRPTALACTVSPGRGSGERSLYPFPHPVHRHPILRSDLLGMIVAVFGTTQSQELCPIPSGRVPSILTFPGSDAPLFRTVRNSPWPPPTLPGHAADHGDP